MRLRSFVALACVLALQTHPARAQLVPQRQSAACEFTEKQAVKKLLKKMGGYIAERDLGIGKTELQKIYGEKTSAQLLGEASGASLAVAVDVVGEYLSHPDETRLEAAVHKLLEGGTKILFPEYGLAVVGGRFWLGTKEKAGLASVAVSRLIDTEQTYQVDLLAQGVFDQPAIANQGIAYANFTDRIRSEAELEKLHAFFSGYYSRQQLEFDFSAESRAEERQKLDRAWAQLESKWKLVWAARLEAELRAQLQQEALELHTGGFPTCTAAAPAVPQGLPGATSRIVLEVLDRTETVDVEWTSGKPNVTARDFNGSPKYTIAGVSTEPVSIQQKVTAKLSFTGVMPSGWTLWLFIDRGVGNAHCTSTTGCTTSIGPNPRGPGWAASMPTEVWLCPAPALASCPSDPVAAENISWNAP